MSISRRQTLAGLIAVPALALAGAATGAATGAVTLVEPFGPNSSTGDAAALLEGAMGRALGATVTSRHVGGDAGGAALDAVFSSPPDGNTLLVTQLLNPYAEERPGDPGGATYRKMTGIARLTGPMSAALVVSHASPITDWAGFTARVGQGRLRVATNASLLFALPLGMLEAQFGRHFDDVAANTRAEVIAALDEGRADFGFLPTISLLTADGRPPLRPILTFGGERNPWFEGVPTYREVGTGKRTAITGAIAMFAPPATAPADRERVLRAVLAAGEDPDVRAAAAALRYPLEISGPAELLKAMDRNARVVRDMRPFLRG